MQCYVSPPLCFRVCISLLRAYPLPTSSSLRLVFKGEQCWGAQTSLAPHLHNRCERLLLSLQGSPCAIDSVTRKKQEEDEEEEDEDEEEQAEEEEEEEEGEEEEKDICGETICGVSICGVSMCDMSICAVV